MIPLVSALFNTKYSATSKYIIKKLKMLSKFLNPKKHDLDLFLK
jgi:hypothetical protein